MKLLIFGGTSTALDIFETVTSFYEEKFHEVLLVIGNREVEPERYPFIRDMDLEKFTRLDKCVYILAFSNHKLRSKMLSVIHELGILPSTIVHPTAVISNTSVLGEGCYVGANVVITQNVKIGKHCIINYQASIGHDSVIFDNVIVNPTACISGNVVIEKNCLVGANSFILQGVKIGKDCLIDALTYIDQNIPEGSLCKNRRLEIIRRKSFQSFNPPE